MLSLQKYNEDYLNGVKKKSKKHGKVLVCRRGCNPLTAIYTREFIWEEVWKRWDTDIAANREMVYNETKMVKGRGSKSVKQGVRRHTRRKESDQDDEVDWE